MTQHRLLPLTALKPWPRNPRRIRPERLEQLKRSLAADPGMMDARPLVALPDGTVIMGNQRLAAAKALGWKRIQTLTVDLDDATAQSWALRDNQGYGEWDADAVGLMLAEMRAAGADLDLAGFEERETQRLLDAITSVPPGVDDAPALPKGKPRSKAGEVYELGDHRLLCGDATSPEDAALLLGDEHAALLFTSPPYGDAREYGSSSMAELAPELLARFLDVYAERASLIAVNLGMLRRDHAVVPYWNAYIEAAARAGLSMLSWNVWDRGQPWSMAQNTAMFPVEHEFILVWGPAKKHRLHLTVANKTPGERTGITNRQPDGSLKKARAKIVRERRALGTVFRSPPHIGADMGHPAMFPVALPHAYIEAMTNTGDLILDPFAGSGTTLVAAHTLGRRAALIEIDPAYCDMIRARYEALA